MEEVSRHWKSLGWRVASGLAFWTLTLAALALFALSVLSTPLCQRQAVRRQLAVEEAKVRQLEHLTEDLVLLCDALSENPKYVARQIRDDLGYRRPGEEPLPVSMRAIAPRLRPLQVKVPPETRLDRVCHVFSQPPVRSLSVVASLMVMAMAFLFFDIPTVSRKDARPAA